jgi:hypothetical protein
MIDVQVAAYQNDATRLVGIKAFSVLGIATAVSLIFHLITGPDELHRSHILLGRHLLFGEPVLNPGHPMWGYSMVIAALGSWTPLLNTLVGVVAYICAFRSLDLARAEPSVSFYIGTFGYAAIITSWHDHALWLSFPLLSLVIMHRYDTRGAATGAAVGLLWGLAYNVRSDALLLFLIFATLSVVYDITVKKKSQVIHHVVLVTVFLIAMVPWGLYTTSALGRYTPTTTQGWAVTYYGLGLVPGNRYGIVPQDEYAAEKAKAIGETSAWSLRSNDYFRSEFINLVSADPGFLFARIGWGLFYALRIGVYTPDLHRAAARSPEDYDHFHYVSYTMRKVIGLPTDGLPQRGAGRNEPISTSDVIFVSINFVLAFVMKVNFIVIVMQMLLLLRRPTLLLSTGPIAVFAASVFLFTFLIAALALPLVRINSVLQTFGIILLQCAACPGRERQTHWIR